MMRLFLCKAREQKRSLLGVNEHFAIRRLVQKELVRTSIKNKKIVDDEIIFAQG